MKKMNNQPGKISGLRKALEQQEALDIQGGFAEHKKAKEALRESETKYRNIFENIRDVYYETSIDGKVLEVSPSIHILSKGLYNREDLIGRNMSDFYDFPEFWDKVASILKKKGYINDYEVLLKNRDGTLVPCSLSSNFLRDEKGKPVKIAGTLRDISERRKEKEALRQKEEQFQSILHAAMDGFCLVDLQGCILTANETFSRMSGYSVSELLGMHISDFEAFETEKITADHIRKAIELGEDRFRTKHRRRDGCFIDVEISVQYNSIEGGRLIVFLRDITERIQAEEERGITADLISLVTTPADFRESMSRLTASLQEWAGCEAVGIRLRDGDDYPYYETRGFPQEFVQAEKHLCAYGPDGKILRDSKGNPVLECMCGNILIGRFDPSQPFFTAHGSFWTNNTTKMLASSSEADRQSRTRNRCNGEGYESVALIPLRVGNEVFGLLQFNDKRIGRFSLERIARFEILADNLAIALSRRKAEEALRQSEEDYRKLFEDHSAVKLIIDPQTGNIFDANFAAADYYGWSRDELKKMNIDQIILSPEEILSGMTKAKAEEKNHFEFKHKLADGSIRDVDVFSSNIHMAGGTYLHSIIFDITERKRAEEALRESEYFFKESQRTGFIGSYKTDFITGFWESSEVLDRIFGIDRSYSRSVQGWLDIVHPDDRELLDRYLKEEVILKRQSFNKEYRIVRKSDGETRWVYGQGEVYFDHEGKIVSMIGTIQDITERKGAEEAIAESETKLNEALKIAKLGAWEYDVALDQFTFNDQFYSLFHTTAEKEGGYIQSVESYSKKFVHPDDSAMVGAETRKAIETTDPDYHSKVDHRIKCADGEIRYITVHIRITKDEKGRTVKSYGVNQDITERKLAEELIQKSEEKFSKAFKASPEAITIATLEDGRYLEVNDVFLKTTGFQREDVIGRTTGELNLWADPGERKRFIDELTEKGSLKNLEARFRMRDGKIKNFLASSEIIGLEGRKCSLSFFLDITDSKKVEEALRESEEKFRNLFNNAEIGMFRTRLDGSEFLDLNDKYLSILGRTREEIIGKPSVSYWADSEEREAMVKALNAKGHVDDLECRLIRKDGKIINCITSVRLYPEQGILEGSIMDITERKMAEKALLQMNRELRVVSRCNEVLMRVTDEMTLLNDICRIVCEEAGYLMAWVGYSKDDETKSVQPQGWAGNEDGYLAKALVSWADTERGRGPTGTSIRTGKTVYIQDFSSDSRTISWVEPALKRGYRSSIALPLKDENAKPFGALTIYASRPDAFTPEEIRLLEELAGDLAFGIVVLRARIERRRAEETLRESEAGLKFSQQVAHLGDWTWDTVKNRVVWSDEMYRIFGLDSLTFDGDLDKIITQTIHPDDREKVIASNNALLTEQNSAPLEYRIVWPDGSVHTVWAESGKKVFDENGKIIKLSGIVLDITQRKKAEDDLRQSEEQLNFALSGTNDGIWDVRMDTGAVYLSPRGCEILGYKPDELQKIADRWNQLVYPEDLPATNKALADYLDGKTPTFSIEQRLNTSAGDWKWILTRGRAVSYDSSGKAIRMVGTHTDISERKQAEQKLKILLEEKSALIQELYHRTKNNMQVIISMISMRMSNTKDTQIVATYKELINRIHAMAKIHEKLYESRNLSRINLKDYLEEMAVNLLYSYRIPPDKISIQLFIEPVEVLIDTAIPCGQIANELLSNAIKYAFPGDLKGKIEVRLSRNTEGVIEMVVSDNGTGISEELEQIKSNKLGLKLVTSLAEFQLKGKVSFDTEKGFTAVIRFADNLHQERV